MDGQNVSGAYVAMMVDALQKKKETLTRLFKMTEEQTRILSQDKLDADGFEKLIEDKGVLIDGLDALDIGFDRLFQSVKGELDANRAAYREEILKMQGLISELSELNVSIQALEKQNSEKFKQVLVRERQSIRDYNVNNRTASAYHQNMRNIHRQDQSYFFDETN